MTTIALHRRLAPAGDSFARSAGFLAIFALALVSLRPFPDLGAADVADLASGRDVVVYVVFALASAVALAAVARSDAAALSALNRPVYGLMALCLAASCFVSPDPATSLKRLALAGMTAALAAAAPLLPRGRAHLAALLAAAAGFVLALSFFGVVALPQFAIHQASDVVEPGLAGDWRGVFAHKNDASLAFGALAFAGLYVARSGRPLIGAAIAAASLVFLVFTRGKTAIILWAPTLVLSLIVARFAAGRLWPALALAPLAALSALGVGSQLFGPLASLTANLPIDPTFTRRTDVWSFALDHLSSHWLTGFGFSSFWNSPAVRYAGDSGWAGIAAHAHNGYLDAALSAGVAGLVLTIWAFVAQPIADIRAAARRGADPALLTLFTQIWLYAITASALESFLFDRANPVWFLILFAVFGLRYSANFRTSPQ